MGVPGNNDVVNFRRNLIVVLTGASENFDGLIGCLEGELSFNNSNPMAPHS